MSLGRAARLELPVFMQGNRLAPWHPSRPSGMRFDPKAKLFYFGCQESLWSWPGGGQIAVPIPLKEEFARWVGTPWKCLPAGGTRLLVWSMLSVGRDSGGFQEHAVHLILVDRETGAAKRLYGSEEPSRSKDLLGFRWRLLDFDDQRQEAVVWDNDKDQIIGIRLEDGRLETRLDLSALSSKGMIYEIACSTTYRRLVYMQARKDEIHIFAAKEDGRDEELLFSFGHRYFSFGPISVVAENLVVVSGPSLLIIDLDSRRVSLLSDTVAWPLSEEEVVLSAWEDPRNYRWVERPMPGQFRLSAAQLRTLQPVGTK